MNDLFKQIPTQFKILWGLGIALQIAVVGVLVWAVIKLVQHFT